MTTLTDECQQDFLVYLPPTTITPPPPLHCPTPSECPEIAYLGEPNIFRAVQGIPGVRFGTENEITSDYELTVIDFEVPVNASEGPVTIFLPLALGSGQFYHIKKTDPSDNPVTVVTVIGDNIDGQPLVVLGAQYVDVALIDAELGYWDRFRSSLDSLTPPIDLSVFARKPDFNEFEELNKFTGVQFRCITVVEDYEPITLDFTVLADATGGPIALNLPPATGSGQLYHFKKIDASEEVVTINRQGTDLIDGAISVNFVEQWGSALLQDAAPGYWDNIGSPVEAADGGGFTPFPTRPTTLNEVIAAGTAIGLWP